MKARYHFIHRCLARQVGASHRRQASSRPQSCAGSRPHYTMISFKILLFVCLQVASAKINGGPRGRFSKFVQTRPSHHISAHHAHFSYHPPANVYYMCRHCSHFTPYPVYHKVPPTYVYKFRESGGRFGALLTGLALYNLGRASAEHWEYTHYYPYRPEDRCSMQVIYHKRIEEIPFPCFMMSSFMNRTPESYFPDSNALDISSPQIDVKQYLQYNGSMIKITREHDCVLWHNTTAAKDRYLVPCSLLMEYAETMKPSGLPVYVWVPTTFAIMMAIYVCCYCYCRKKAKDDDVPFNSGTVIGYTTNTNVY